MFPHEFWDRIRQAFSCVCLPVSRVRATALAWGQHAVADLSQTPARVGFVTSAVDWICSADVVSWIVPLPSWQQAPVCTFRDGAKVLPQLVTSGIRLPAVSAVTVLGQGPQSYLVHAR